MDKEIRISLSIFWDIALQGGNEVMRDLSNSFIYGFNHDLDPVEIKSMSSSILYILGLFFSRSFLCSLFLSLSIP